jgi:hypothetical protein
MHKTIQLISKSLYNKNMPLSMKVHVHWMNLMKNQIKQKFQSFEILKEKAIRQRIHFLNHLIYKKMFNGFKMFSFICRSHVQEIILLKNMFGCPLKFILGFYGIICIFGIKPKYSYIIMYECEKSPLTHELSYLHYSIFFI